MSAIATAAALSLPISFSRSTKFGNKREGGLVERKNPWTTLFDVEDPRSKVPHYKGKFVDVHQALEVARYDIQYCDWKARQDVLTIMLLHEKVVEVLNPLAREFKSIGTLKKELAELQEELAQAHNQVHISEARISTALDKLAFMEILVNDKKLQDRNTTESDLLLPTPSTSPNSLDTVKRRLPKKSLNVSGPVQPYHARLRNFWYPVAFSADLKDDTMVPIDCFEEPWVLFRGKDGKPGCVQNTCAHRACPLHLGSVNEGRIQCPYHGWEYSTDGKCEKMPSTKLLNVKLRALPCFEQEGMIWIWPGDDPPTADLPSLLPPSGFQIHAELGEILDTHIWSARILGSVSHRHGISTTLYATIPIFYLELHEQVLNEDLRLVLGQQERMLNGANVWNWPVSYDKLGVRYRLWRDSLERGSEGLPFSKSP
ncbi:UNVERIFIED_CONTAM: Chlorophyllide a oxygenase, chloroplastic [Sesamum radiatum]|uniref:Chlorophyllide a oxygenase, chloroplastic n=1 Tax=Sesamum radiatum TaxID=300843 RepID=A0AAW2PXN3_SESRA